MPDKQLENWVNQATDPKHQKERQVIHIILSAITKINEQFQIALKGGVLIAMRYGSTRHTRDIDFSTRELYSKDHETAFLKSLEKALLENEFDYPIQCRVQSFELRPQTPKKTFPTLKVKIGYASLGDQKSLKRLANKNSLDVLSIDYSYNEIPIQTEQIEVIDGRFVETYDFNEIIAEKLRALLQQKVRDRHREQDVYDLYYLLSRYPVTESREKEDILMRFKKKSERRNLEVDQDSIDNPEIKKRAGREYKNLADTIEEDLPDFEIAFSVVQSFYRGLPW